MRVLYAAAIVLALLASQTGPLGAQERARKPAAESRTEALSSVVRKLGSFDSVERERAARTLGATGEAGISALLLALTDRHLAVRVGAHDTFRRLLADRYHAAPAAIPNYDPWEPSPIRAARARELRIWWNSRGRSPVGVL